MQMKGSATIETHWIQNRSARSFDPIVKSSFLTCIKIHPKHNWVHLDTLQNRSKRIVKSSFPSQIKIRPKHNWVYLD